MRKSDLSNVGGGCSLHSLIPSMWKTPAFQQVLANLPIFKQIELRE
jgi:hypothetical protein